MIVLRSALIDGAEEVRQYSHSLHSDGLYSYGLQLRPGIMAYSTVQKRSDDSAAVGL